jgi:hypothetical protein
MWQGMWCDALTHSSFVTHYSLDDLVRVRVILFSHTYHTRGKKID